jgi:tRNA threonylcarbamoyladenosine biosynthesis protein TsaB
MVKIAAMIILTIRTDKPQAEIGLFDSDKRLTYLTWEAQRILAVTLNNKINEILLKSDMSFNNVQGIVCFKGPGSFTGLRIGMSTANALSYSFKIPVVSAKGDQWQNTGIQKLLDGKNEKIALPNYGSEPATTKPRK